MLTAMSNEIRGLTEALAALATLMGLLACVNEHMLFHVRLLMESLPAVITRKRPDIGVYQHVRR